MAGLGFKIADGYVEVHARYDKGELQRAAQQAADDSDTAYNKERERNAKSGGSRDTNRRIGQQANVDFVRGVREQADRQKENPFIRVDNVKRDASRLGRVHVQEFGKGAEQEVNRSRSRFKAIGMKVASHMFGKDNAAAAGVAFFKRFAEAITFGQADFSSPKITGAMTRIGAGLGTTLGVALAAALVAEIGNAITALSPLLLAAAAALPIIGLIRSGMFKEKGKWHTKTNEMGLALRGLVKEFKSFMKIIEAPLKAPVLNLIAGAAASMKTFAPILSNFFRQFTPGLQAAVMGVFTSIITFVQALTPALPGLNAGLKAWGEELPKIGKALGDMFAAILKDPAAVTRAVQVLSQTLQILARVLGFLIPVLSSAASFLHNFGNAMVLGARIAQLFVAAWKGVAAFFKEVFTKDIPAAFAALKQRLSEAKTAVSTKAKEIVDAVVKWLKSLPGKGHAAIVTFPAKLMKVFNEAAAKVAQKAKELVTKAVAKLKELPGKAKAALSTLASKIATEVTQAKDKAVAKAKELVTKAVTALKALPGKAKTAISSLASKVGTEFTQAVTKAKAKAKELVDGFIKKLKELPGKAKAEAGKVKGAVTGALSGAGSWLVSAGKALMNGLADGIRAGLTWVKNAAVAAAKAAVGAAKKALGIKSPSAVAAEQVGKPIAQGIGLGMRKHVSEEFKELPGMLPKPASGKVGRAGNTYHSTSSFSPTINVHIAAGLDPIDGAARRALVKGLYLETEKFRKDYVNR